MVAGDLVQVIYFNDFPWYGVRLASDILNKSSEFRQFRLVKHNHAVSARTHVAVLLSFLSSREYPRLFRIFDYLKIPYFSNERTADHPLVIAGGSACYNPEPIADMVDVVCVGDGEEMLAELPKCLSLRNKEARLRAILELPGAYEPGARSILYDKSGFFVRDVIGDDSVIIPNITDKWHPRPQSWRIQPEIEIARGCNHNCFFCAIAWRMDFRYRPKDNLLACLDDKQMSFFAPNIGSVPYYSEIENRRGRSTKGDMAVSDFLLLPEPTFGDYKGHTFTFGIEGISPRLRKILGKPITQAMLQKMSDKLLAGNSRRIQLYFIRGVPTEGEEDWDILKDWLYSSLPIWEENDLHAVEVQFTPLIKTAHTPLQWFKHEYNRESEAQVWELLEASREDKANRPDDAGLYITPSKRQPRWMIDSILELGGRNTTQFMWADFKGLLSHLKSDQEIGKGSERVKGVARKCGIDVDVMLGDLPLDAVLPYSHIQPMGERGRERLLKAARALGRKLKS